MSPEKQSTSGPSLLALIRGSAALLGFLVIARFVLEVAGVPHALTRFLSSTAATMFVGIYIGVVAPLRGVTRYVKLIVPSIVLAVWSVGWVILATLVSGAFRLERSHFAGEEDLGNWANLGHHLLDHVIEIPIVAALLLVLMAVPFLLRRWPVTVGPAAMLGALVIARYWLEAMGAGPEAAVALSSTVGVLVCGFYLGAIGQKFGLESARRLFVPAIAIAWAWRFWIFLAELLSAIVPFYKTHFFDPSAGHVAVRLAGMAGIGLVGGFVFGLVVWGIAVWVSRAIRPATSG